MFRKRLREYYMTHYIKYPNGDFDFVSNYVRVDRKLNSSQVIDSINVELSKELFKEDGKVELTLVNFKYLGKVRVDTK